MFIPSRQLVAVAGFKQTREEANVEVDLACRRRDGARPELRAVFAKELKSIGVSLGSLGNPFFVALSKGAEFEAKKINPNVKITTVGFDYDLGKQVTQIDNFIAAGVDLILLNPGDPKAIGRRSRRRRPPASSSLPSTPQPTAPTPR